MTNQDRTMREVVASLQETKAEALPELLELQIAARELAKHARKFSVALREIAAEAAQLALDPSAASLERLVALRDFTEMVSSSAEAQSVALRELMRGIQSWGLDADRDSDSGSAFRRHPAPAFSGRVESRSPSPTPFVQSE